MKVYSLDTFAGMPATNSDIDAHQEGDFKEVDLDELRELAAAHGLGNLEFVQGLYQDTAPGVLSRTKDIVLAHIDCDIYSSVAYSYEVVRARIASGGYLVFDDATVSSCLGATEVVESVLIRRDGMNLEQISHNSYSGQDSATYRDSRYRTPIGRLSLRTWPVCCRKVLGSASALLRHHV